jgi:hypothetical protein
MMMTDTELERIRLWDGKCINEGYMFPVALDRRRLLEYVDELRAENQALKEGIENVRRTQG